MSEQLSARIADENIETLNKLVEQYGSKSNVINYLLSNCNTTGVIQSESVIQQATNTETGEIIDVFGLSQDNIAFFNDLCDRLYKRSGKNPIRLIQIACNYYYRGLYGQDIEKWMQSMYSDYKCNTIEK